MKKLITAIILALSFTSTAAAGEATATRTMAFDVPVKQLIEKCKAHRNEMMKALKMEVLADDGKTMKVKAYTLKGITTLTLALTETFDDQRGHFESKLIKTEGIITDQYTSFRISMVNGKTTVIAKVFAEVPTARSGLIQTDLNGKLRRLEREIQAILSD